MSIYFVFALGVLNGVVPGASRVVLALYALELGAQPITVGILGATFSVLPMLLSVPAGKLADRYGARRLLMYVGAVGALGLLAPFFFPGLSAIFVAAALAGMSDGLFSVSLQNLVGLLSNVDNRARNFTNYSMIGSVGNFMGPLVAGFSIELLGHNAACLFLALSALIPVAMLAIRGGTLRGGARPRARTGGGVHTLLSEPGVRRMLATTSLLNTGQDLYKVYMPVYAHAIGLSASSIGMVLAVNSAAMFGVRVILPRLIARFKEQKVLACAFYVGAASLMLIPFFQSAVILGLISFIFGLGMGCGQPILTILMFSSSAEGRSGEAMGLRMSVLHLTRIVGPIAFGSIGSAFGLIPMFWVNALMMGTGGRISQAKK